MIRRTGREWAALNSQVILDPDGWRIKKIDLDTPITLEQYNEMLLVSTVSHRPKERKSDDRK